MGVPRERIAKLLLALWNKARKSWKTQMTIWTLCLLGLNNPHPGRFLTIPCKKHSQLDLITRHGPGPPDGESLLAANYIHLGLMQPDFPKHFNLPRDGSLSIHRIFFCYLLKLYINENSYLIRSHIATCFMEFRIVYLMRYNCYLWIEGSCFLIASLALRFTMHISQVELTPLAMIHSNMSWSSSRACFVTLITVVFFVSKMSASSLVAYVPGLLAMISRRHQAWWSNI